MRSRSPLAMKLIYLGGVAVLLVPLAALSTPSTPDARTGQRSQGGVLPRLRDENGLSQTSLGQIDPTGEAIKLASLGMRGVAANILWTKANEYKKTEDWTSLSATLEQITHLQPHFIAVWRYQGWNLSYNVSVEFDDYHDRYYWVMKGIDFLQQGVPYNESEPRLLWDIGWFISHKIGRADERRQYRQLFVEDDDFHGTRPMSDRDNWLVGKEWIRDAEYLVDRRGASLKTMSPLVFYSYAPICQMNYADALEEGGTFGEVARRAWERAALDWEAYGERTLVIGPDGQPLRLADANRHIARARNLAGELAAYIPEDLPSKIAEEKYEALSPEERRVLEMVDAARTPEERALAIDALGKLFVDHVELAENIEGPKRARAIEIAHQAREAQSVANYLDQQANTVNYRYWKTRCAAERTDDAIEARRLAHQANQALADSDFETACEMYEQSLETWRRVLDAFPSLVDDGTVGDDFIDVTKRYRHVLKQLGQPFPEDFILQDVVDRHEQRMPGDFKE